MNKFPVENIDKVNSAKVSDTSIKLSNARIISLSGDVSGNTTFDGSSNKDISVEVSNNSHTHTVANITNLQNNLDTINTSISDINTNLNSKGVKLSVNGTTLKLLDSNDNELSSVTTKDTVYTLPNATSSKLGGVKIGSNITVSSGTISLTENNVTTALGYTPVKTVNDISPDNNGNVDAISLMMPDYSAGVEITSALADTNKSYTVPYNCALISPVYHNEGHTLILYHTANYTYSNNNKKYVIVDSRPRAMQGDDHASVFVLLKKGQVIYNDTTTITNAKVFIYPLG